MSSIKIRMKQQDGNTQIRVLISHPMETGRNKDLKSGKLIPAHFIQELTVKHNDKVVVSGNIGAGVSKDPYFAFMLKGGKVGDKVTISWRDNLGNMDNEEKLIE